MAPHPFRDVIFPRLGEWISTAVMFNWSVVLFYNTTLMAENPAFGYLLGIAPQKTWALSCLIWAVTRAIVLVINGTWRRSPHLRALCSIAGCMLWTQIVLSFSASVTTGLAVYPVLLVADIINIVRATRDARSMDDFFRVRKDDGKQ